MWQTFNADLMSSKKKRLYKLINFSINTIPSKSKEEKLSCNIKYSMKKKKLKWSCIKSRFDNKKRISWQELRTEKNRC